jgi:hypothetical protein
MGKIRIIVVVLGLSSLCLGSLVFWPARPAAGIGNYGLSFDGNNSEVRGPVYPGSNGTQTMEVWVKPNTNNAYGIVVDTRNDGDNQGWIIELRNSQAELWIAGVDGIDRSLLHSGVNLQRGQWYHVAATYDAVTHQARLFVDGQPSNSADLGVLSVGPQMRMGRFGVFASFGGMVDEIRVSNVLRYTSVFARPTGPFSADANTLALYHLDEGSGQAVLDSSGRGNNLTLGQTALVESSDPLWSVSDAPLNSLSPTPTFTPPTTVVPTPTNTPIPTPTLTTTPSPTKTPLPTPTKTPTPPPTNTPTPIFTPTNTSVPTPTNTPTPSATPIPGASLVVTAQDDDGTGNSAGSLSKALTLATAGKTITFKLPAGVNTIKVTGKLPYIQVGVNLQAPCINGPGIIIDGTAVPGIQPGLVLLGNNRVEGIKVTSFKGIQIQATSRGNQFKCVVINNNNRL